MHHRRAERAVELLFTLVSEHFRDWLRVTQMSSMLSQMLGDSDDVAEVPSKLEPASSAVKAATTK